MLKLLLINFKLFTENVKFNFTILNRVYNVLYRVNIINIILNVLHKNKMYNLTID